MGGIVENASEKLIELKFGVFGSIGEVKFLPDKNIGKFISHYTINSMIITIIIRSSGQIVNIHLALIL